MNYEPGLPNSGRRGNRTGFTYEDANRRYKTFPAAFKYTIIIIALVVLYFLIDAGLNSHMMVSSRDYENVDSISVDDMVINNNEELFDLLKKTWTKVPSAGLMVSVAEEFVQHKITVKYTDGTQDIITLYYNPYMEDNNGYVLRIITDEKVEERVLSYSGYDILMEYIEKSIG
jgi:hypothetical protein